MAQSLMQNPVSGKSFIEGVVIARGEEMMPLISHGDQIKIKAAEKDNIKFGRVHLVITLTQSTMARIFRGSTPGKWLLKRENNQPGSVPRFEDFEIYPAQVVELYQITHVLKTLD